MARIRDYKAEYASRIKRGLAMGLTRGQARGHPEAGLSLVKHQTSKSIWNERLEEGLKRIRKGDSASAVARQAHVDPGRLRNYLVQQGVGEKNGGRWRIGEDTRMRNILIYSGGKPIEIQVRGYDACKLIGEYMEAVRQFLADQNKSHLKPYDGVSVADINSKSYALETNPNALYRIHISSDRPFEQVYSFAR